MQKRMDPGQVQDIEALLATASEPPKPERKEIQQAAVRKLARVYAPLLLRDNKIAREYIQYLLGIVDFGMDASRVPEIESWLVGDPEPVEPPPANARESVAITGQASLK